MCAKKNGLEKLVEIAKVQSTESSKNWHEDSNDNSPFTKYLLGTILAAYRDFEDRLSLNGWFWKGNVLRKKDDIQAG